MEEPEDRDDYENFKWYLFRKGCSIFQDHEGDWYVAINLKCKHLNPKGLCDIYEERPPVCRDYDVCECDNDEEAVSLETPEEVEEYIKELEEKGEL